MGLIQPILDHPVSWALFGAYVLGTAYLAWLGHKKTDDMSSFALGQGDMHPAVVGITLASSIASTATFVINPGFVYKHGLSAFFHFGFAAGTGIVTGLLVLSLGFRKLGETNEALTLPHWIGARYESRAMTIFFAAINLLSVMFLVLIVGALSIVMQQTLGVGNVTALVIIVGFVFSYIFVGGTYAHAYTNTLQGFVMAIIAAIIVASGLGYFSGGWEPVATELAKQDPNLVEAVNPESALYGSTFSIWVAGVVIGFALISQPHILIKTLYVDSDRDMWKSLGVCIVVTLLFTSLLLVGFYARLYGIPTDVAQDEVLTVYVTEVFPPVLVAIISVTLLAAGMSTLDGLLIALSSIVANDLFLNWADDSLLADRSEEETSRIGHHVGQGVVVVLGLLTFGIALNPPKLLGIFGQIGTYGIVAASSVPILAGIFFDDIDHRWIFASAVAGISVHLGCYFTGMWAGSAGVSLVEAVQQLGPLAYLFDTNVAMLGFKNPAVTATYGIFASALVAAPTCISSLAGGDRETTRGAQTSAAE